MQRNREAVPDAGRMKTNHTNEDRQNQGTIPIPTFATKPLTTSSTVPVELTPNYMVGQQRQQKSELRFDKFLIHNRFLCEQFDSKTVSTRTHNFCIFNLVNPASSQMLVSQSARVHLTHRSCVHLFTAPMHPHWLESLSAKQSCTSTFNTTYSTKTQVATCNDLPSDAMLWSKEVEMVDSLDELKSSRSVSGVDFQTSRCWTRRLLLLWTRSLRIPNSISLEEQKAEKRGPVSTRTDRLHDLRLLSSDWRSWHSIRLIYSLLLFMTIMFRNSKQDGTKFYYRCQKIHQIISWKVCTNWGYVSLINSKLY